MVFRKSSYYSAEPVSHVAQSLLDLRRGYDASIVLRFENCDKDVVSIETLRYEGSRDKQIEKKVGAGVVILAGDAEFDSWAQISEEYPCITSTSKNP